MFTLFDLLQWIGLIIGAVVGAVVGNHYLGGIGVVVGGALGLAVGFILGKAPFAISWILFRRNLSGSSADELKERLASEYFVSHLLIAELARRGEPVEQFWPYILGLLKSDNFHERKFGWHNFQIWFPRFAAQLDGFDPNGPTEECRRAVATIEFEEPDASAVSATD